MAKNKNNKKQNSKNCLMPLKQDANYLASMHQVKLQRTVPQMVRELLQGKINLEEYAPYLLGNAELANNILQYLYAEAVNAQADYNAYQYYLLNAMNNQDGNQMVGLYTTKVNNASSRLVVYSDMYQGFMYFFQTGDYRYILPQITKNSRYAHQISTTDNSAIDYVTRQLNPRRNNRQNYNRGNNNNGGYRNGKDRSRGSGFVPREK